jgi:PD-(D/E)XK endonuclease
VVSVLTTDQKGTVAELAIARAAVELGIGVSKPFGDERYDLVFDLRPGLVRVQCKAAVFRGDHLIARCYRARRTATGVLRQFYSAADVDAFAVHCSELRKSYFLPLSVFGGRSTIQLRVEPTRNNQSQGVNWAKDFEFAATLRADAGAIAQLGERRAGSAKVAGSSPAGSIEEPRQAGLFS